MAEQDLHHTHTHTYSSACSYTHIHTHTQTERESRSRQRHEVTADVPTWQRSLLLFLPTDGASVCYADGKARPHTRAATCTHTHTYATMLCARVRESKACQVVARASERALTQQGRFANRSPTKLSVPPSCHRTIPYPCLWCLVMPVCLLGCSCCAD